VPASAPPRDLVLGLVHGYPAAKARVFLDSLRRVAPHAEVILASSEISDETTRELTELGCKLLPYRYHRLHVAGRKIWPGNTRWGRVHRRYAAWINAIPGFSADQKLVWRARTARHFLDPNTRRFVEFYLALRDILPSYRRVLLSDLRDVVFQANPFSLIEGAGIMYGLEDESLSIGTQWANSHWLEQVGGAALRDELASERISCVGVVLGSGPVMASYLRGLVEALTQPGINLANFHGADTGAHNIVVRRGGLPNPRFADFRTGGILNMHGLRPEFIRWNADNLLCDANGRPFAVVHQYDRHPDVAERLLRRLGV
jgi:hypothetical protein